MPPGDRLELLPVQGYVSFRQGLVPCLKHLVLPSCILGMVNMALIVRMTRATGARRPARHM